MHQERQCSLAVCRGCSLTGEHHWGCGLCLQAHSAVGTTQLGFSSSRVVGLMVSVLYRLLARVSLSSLPRVPLHRAPLTTAAGLPLIGQMRTWEGPPTSEASLRNLVSEVTPHHLCWLLFTRSESIHRALVEVGGTMQGHEHKELDHWGIPETAHHRHMPGPS